MTQLASQTATEFTAQMNAEAYAAGVDRHYWHLSRNRMILRTVRGLGLAAPRVLDFGCGRGIVLQHLRNAGLDTIGYEPSSGWRDSDLPAGLYAQLDHAATTHPDINVALLLDVIEHLAEPLEALDDCRRHFPHLRHFVVTVPARPELWSNYDEHFGHYRRYVPTDLVALAGRLEGFRLVSWRYLFQMLYLPALLLRALGRPRSIHMPPPRHPAVHAALSRVIDVQHACLPRGVYGSSLLAVLSHEG